MLITCNGCSSKIRVPDSAAGKRVKCPKCATLIRVPEAEKPAESTSAAPEAGVSSVPLPAPPAPTESEPEEQPEETADPEAFSTKPSSSGSKPPPIKKKRASSVDDGEDDDDEPKPPSKRRPKYDDDDDDDDDLDVRNRRGTSRPRTTNSMAMTSMIIGVVSVVVGIPGCCCCGPLAVIGGICGLIAVILGFMGKSPGSEGFAWTGIICGFVSIGFSLIYIVIVILSLFMNIGMAGMNGMNFNQGPNFNQQPPNIRR